MAEKSIEASIFAIRTTAGQEKNAAELIEAKVKTQNIAVLSILVPETLRGYIFLEARDPYTAEEAIAGIKHAKSKLTGKVQFAEIEKYLESKPVIDELGIGDIVEITGGPFKSMKAQVTKINKVRQEATLELLEATFTLPITVNADYLKPIKKATRTQVPRSVENE